MTEDPEFDARLERLERIAEVVGKFQDPALQAEAYHYLIGDGVHARGDEPAQQPRRKRANAPKRKPDEAGDDLGEARKPARRTAGRKQNFEFLKELDFYDKTGPSKLGFKEFVEKHPPKKQEEKVTVAIYWLKHEAGNAQISIDMVYTAFKTVSWPVPSSLSNAIHRAGSLNYLDSKNREDILLTTHGENLVEHQLTATTE
ncbi:hypothetical protein KN248_012985 [Mycobacterium paraintracellulare]|uniref:hypothetical protein n=1 Tax=Mycobacterium paraintracellulare TaxID=1138383 RepID=UPI001EED1FC2|nr:hypothetical protein [Mycobacterium paraintracellulare]WVL46268.1 hypothetical protein KN248_012985 [Mycobacterium paraintracellulare]